MGRIGSRRGGWKRVVGNGVGVVLEEGGILGMGMGMGMGKENCAPLVAPGSRQRYVG